MDTRGNKHTLGEEILAEDHVTKRSRIAPLETDAACDSAKESAAQAEFHGSGIQHSGQGSFNVQGNVNISTASTADSEMAGQCVRKLFQTDPSEDREMLKRKKGNRANGTCEWILDTEEFAAWFGSDETKSKTPGDNVLWLHGNPGTGKSIMAIFLSENLSKRFSNMEDKTLAYFFCDASFEKRKTATSIVRGLLFQLLQMHQQLLHRYVLPQYGVRGEELFKSFDALWEIFIAAAADQSTGQKYFIIDALDECDNESQQALLYQLQETFQSRQNAPPNVRILITSRPYPEIREYLEDFIHRDLASFYQSKQDIDQCIKERVEDLAKRKKYTEKVKKDVSDMLRDKAEGTFLWVGLACEELRQKPSKDAVKFLQDMPKGLSSLYKKLLNTATESQTDEGDIIRRVLGFVAVSFKVLSVLELSDACRLHTDEQDVDTRLQYTRDQIASCRLLVVIQDKKVQLLHQSVRDFLVGSASNSNPFIDRLEAHAGAAYCCVDFLIDRLNNMQLDSHSFLVYASSYWTEHAREAQDRFKAQGAFFAKSSPSRDLWLENLAAPELIGRNLERYPLRFPLLHVAAWWGLPTLVKYALGMREKPAESARYDTKDVNCPDWWGASPLEWAVQSRHTEAIDILLQLGANVTESIMELAVKCYRGDVRVLSLLLDQCKDRTLINRKILSGTAGNWYYRKELIMFILKGYTDQIVISEDILRRAASDEHDVEITKLLLQHQGSQITISEDVMKAAVRNGRQGAEITQLLLQHQGSQITISEHILTEAVRNRKQGAEIIRHLLQHQGSHITISEHILKKAAQNEEQGKDIIELFLHYQGDHIFITEAMMMAAANSGIHGMDIIKIFLQHQGIDRFRVTEDMLKASIRNRKHDEAIVEFFLQQHDQTIITEDIIKTAAKYSTGKRVMELLLHYAGDRITISVEVAKAAAGNYRSQGPMEALLQHFRDTFPITEEIINAALCMEANMKLLLLTRGDQITITEKTIAKAAQYYDKSVMELLLHHGGHQITISEELAKVAATNRRGPESMEVLLRKYGNEFPITEEVLEAAIRNERDEEMLKCLLQHRGDQIIVTEKMMKIAAEGFYAGQKLELLLRKCGDGFQFSERLVEVAVRYCNEDTVVSLFERLGDDFVITEKILKAAIEDPQTTVYLLERLGNDAAMTEKMLEAAIKQEDEAAISFIFERLGDEFIIKEKTVEAAVKHCDLDMVEFFLQRLGDEFTITESIMKAAAKNKHCGSTIFNKILLEDYEDRLPITEEIMKAVVANEKEAERLIALIYDKRRGQFVVTNDVLLAATKNEFLGEKYVRILFQEQKSQIIITEEMVRCAAENWNGEAFTILFQERGSQIITITEDILMAAASNKSYGDEIMNILFQEPESQIAIATEAVLYAAILNRERGSGILEILLRNQAPNITITKQVMFYGMYDSNIERLFRQNPEWTHRLTREAVAYIHEENLGAEFGIKKGEEISDISEHDL